ncbi:transposase, partial [Candidatus Accumulibacter vicinus]|uniref:transposase n=1 Tax=Candidatus Accumulibacter vicinus TaxID=2954382 RepID=UPI0030811449
YGQSLRPQRHPCQARRQGHHPGHPPKSNRLEIIVYDQERYKQRNKVECLFNKRKQFCRVVTRYEKLKANFLAFVTVAPSS